MNEPITIGKVAETLDIPTSTARQYVKDFQDTEVFSQSATPEKGKTRLFTDDDINVMWTIKFYRAQHMTTKEVAEMLKKGERYYPEADENETAEGPPASQDAAESTQNETTAIQLYDAFKETLQAYETRVTTYENEVRDLRDRLQDAEIRAAKAETELDILKAKKPSFWQRIFGGGN